MSSVTLIEEWPINVLVEEYFQDKKHTNESKFHNLKYIDAIKIAQPIGSLTLGIQVPSAVATSDESSYGYTVADLYEFVKKYDGDFNALKGVSAEELNADGTPRLIKDGAFEGYEAFVDTGDGTFLQRKSADNIGTFNKYSPNERYSLREVEPIQPTSSSWSRTLDTAEGK